jgi:predicted sulfurtransferase
MRFVRMSGYIALVAAMGAHACSPAPEAGSATVPQLEGAERDAALVDDGVVLLDVREPSELEELGTVQGYVNIPIDQLADRLDELPRDKPILTL